MAGKKLVVKKGTKKVAAKKPAAGRAKVSAKRAAPRAKTSAKKSKPNKARVASPAVVHWEIQAKDAKKIQRFYADLFGWKIDAANPMNYGMVPSQGKGSGSINGGIGGTMSGAPRILVYANVADIDGFLQKAESLGARTILPRTDVGPVIMGIFEDIEGNQFGIIEG